MAASSPKILGILLLGLIILAVLPVLGVRGINLGELRSIQSGRVDWFYTDGTLHKPLDSLTGCSTIPDQRKRIEQLIAEDQIHRGTTILPPIFMLRNRMSVSFCGEGSLHTYSGFSPNLLAWAVEIVVLLGALKLVARRRKATQEVADNTAEQKTASRIE